MPNESIQYDAKLNLTSLENDLKAAEQRVSQFFAKLEKRLTQPIKLKIDTSDVDKKLTAIEKRFERLSRQSIHVAGGSTLANGTPVRTAQSYLPVAQSAPMLGMSPATVATTSLLPTLMVNGVIKALGTQSSNLSMGGSMSPSVRRSINRAAAAATFLSHPAETKEWYQSEQRRRGIHPEQGPTIPFSGPHVMSALSGGAIPIPDVNESFGPGDTMRGVPWAALHLGPRNPRPRAGWWSNQRRAWGIRAGKFRRWWGQTATAGIGGMASRGLQNMGFSGAAAGMTNAAAVGGSFLAGATVIGNTAYDVQMESANSYAYQQTLAFQRTQPGFTSANIDAHQVYESGLSTLTRSAAAINPLHKAGQGIRGLFGMETEASIQRYVADTAKTEQMARRRLQIRMGQIDSRHSALIMAAQTTAFGTDDNYKRIVADAEAQAQEVEEQARQRRNAAAQGGPVFTDAEAKAYQARADTIRSEARQDAQQAKATDRAIHAHRLDYFSDVLSNPFKAQEDQIRQRYDRDLKSQDPGTRRRAQQEMAAELGTHRQLFNRQMADTSAQLRTVGQSNVFAARQAAGGYSFAAAQTQLQGQIQLVRYQDAQVNARYAQPAQRQNLHNQYAQQIATLAAQLQQNRFNNQTSRLSMAGQLGQGFATLGDNPFVAQLLGIRTQAALDARDNPQNAGLINQNLSVQERVLSQQFGRSDYQQRRLTGSINSSAQSLELRMRGDFGSAQLQDIQDNITRQINLVDPSLPQDIQQKRIAAIKNLGEKQIEALERQYAGGYGSSYNIGAFTSTNIPSAYPLTKEQKKQGIKTQTLDLDQFFGDLPGVQAAIEAATNSGYTGAKRDIPETPGSPLTPSGGQATDKIVGLLTRIAAGIDQFVSGGFVAGP